MLCAAGGVAQTLTGQRVRIVVVRYVCVNGAMLVAVRRCSRMPEQHQETNA